MSARDANAGGGLWLALRHGSVTILVLYLLVGLLLWLALRHGSVTILVPRAKPSNALWLALRHGSVTIQYRKTTA